MSHKHARHSTIAGYRWSLGFHTGSLLIMAGLVLILVGEYIPGIALITFGAVLTLDYFLINVFLNQTSPPNKHRAARTHG